MRLKRDVAFEEYDGFADTGTLYGISADSAFSQSSFADEYGFEFDLLSDMGGDAYGLQIDIGNLGLYGVAQRAVFVVNGDGEVTYAWVSDGPTNEPDYDEVQSAVEAAA